MPCNCTKHGNPFRIQCQKTEPATINGDSLILIAISYFFHFVFKYPDMEHQKTFKYESEHQTILTILGRICNYNETNGCVIELSFIK